ALKTGNSINFKEIDKVEVETYNLAARCNIKRPETRLQSKFSIPYVVACILMDVDLFGDYEDNVQQVENLAYGVFVSENQELTKLLPDRRAAKVTVTLKDGTELEHTTYTAKGEYDHRFSEEELWDKYQNMLINHYDVSFLGVLKNNLLNIRRYPTFKEWLQANRLMGESTCKN